MDNGQEWKRVEKPATSDSEKQHGNEHQDGSREGRTGSGRYYNDGEQRRYSPQGGGERRYNPQGGGYGGGERRYSPQGSGERRYNPQGSSNSGERRYNPQGSGGERRYSPQGGSGGSGRYPSQGGGGGRYPSQGGSGGRYPSQGGGGERRYTQQGSSSGGSYSSSGYGSSGGERRYSAPSHGYGNRMQDQDFNYDRNSGTGYDSGYIDLNSAVDHVPGKSKRKRIVKKVATSNESSPYQKVNMQRPPRKKTPPPPPKKRPKIVIPEYPDVPFEGPVRLNRYISNTGLCSRREADDNIKEGNIKVNGQVVTEMGLRVDPTKDEVLFKDKPINSQRKVYLLLNKPKGFVTSMSDPNCKKLVMDLVRAACKERIYPVGRLDKMTTGVLLFTNDGDLSLKLTHPSNRMRKVYQVMLDKPLTDEDMEKLSSGIELEDGNINFDSIAFTDPDNRHMVGVEIHSGKNRIVRRMFEAANYKVVKLDRVYFAGLTRKGLKRGKWRFLSPEEVAFLKMMPSS